MDREKRHVKREGQVDDKKLEGAVERAVTKAMAASRGRARSQVVSFFDFIRERGVIGLAVGIVIGSAVTNLVHVIVDSIISPIVGLFLVDKQLKGSTFNIGRAVIGWGDFVSALIDFLIIALTVYILFRVLGLEKLDKKPEKKEPF